LDHLDVYFIYNRHTCVRQFTKFVLKSENLPGQKGRTSFGHMRQGDIVGAIWDGIKYVAGKALDFVGNVVIAAADGILKHLECAKNDWTPGKRNYWPRGVAESTKT
jgi:hypothetical protein